MLKGKIIKINSSKYFVESDNKIYDCTVKGVFRKDKITPLVGDCVEIDEKAMRIQKIFERKNFLLRPNVSNVDLALIMVSVKKPDLDLYLLDKLLVNVVGSNIMPVICFSKIDLLQDEEKAGIIKIKNYYEKIGYKTLFNDEIEKFSTLASKKTVVLTGQTGAGKSSFINKLDATLNLETKMISESLGRGMHTTRYVSLYKINDYYVVDTPGFSFLEVNNFDIKQAFPEFNEVSCKYKDCSHINTDGCMITCNIGNVISKERYENYKKLLGEQNESSRKLFKK